MKLGHGLHQRQSQTVALQADLGLDKPNIGILDHAFLAGGRNLQERNLAVELLERLLEGENTSRFAGNLVQSKEFSDLLTEVVQRFQNRSLEAAQVMDERVQRAKNFRDAAVRELTSGAPPVGANRQ